MEDWGDEVMLEEEVNLMVSQNAIPSKQHLGGAYIKEKSIVKQAASQFETNIGQQAVGQLVHIEGKLSGGEEL